MDSFPTPSADEPDMTRETTAQPSDAVRIALSEALPATHAEVAECAFHFLTALDRLAEGIRFVGCALENPTPKKMGMAVSSILMRAREAAAYWRRLEPAASGLTAGREQGSSSALPTASALAREQTAPPDPSVPRWRIPEGEWLSDRCAAVLSGWRNLRLLADAIAAEGSAEGRLAAFSLLLAGFRDETWPALADEDGLLKGLPRLQEEITKRIYRAEAFGE